VTRSPVDVLTRSFAIIDPNASKAENKTTTTMALEAHWKNVSSGVLHDMMDTTERHRSDPRALSVKLEDLLSSTHGNTTLKSLFSFLLGQSSGERVMQTLIAHTTKVLHVVARSELQGDTQRKHLGRLIVRKPAKCSHINTFNKALGYPIIGCVEPTPLPSTPASAGAGSADGGAARTRQRTRKRSRRRRLNELDGSLTLHGAPW